MPIKCGSCGQYHPTIAAVKACSRTPNVPAALRTFTEQDERDMQRMEAEGDRAQTYREEAAKADFKARMESPSAELIERVSVLLVTREIPANQYRWSRAMRAYISGDPGSMTVHALEVAIARLESYPVMRANATRSVERASVPGLYRKDGHLYQVVFNKNKTHLYAKMVTFPPADSQSKRPSLAYAPGVLARLTVEDLVPIEEAQAITRKTGWCWYGHFLTDPKSIARGMGPVCWARYGAPVKDIA